MSDDKVTPIPRVYTTRTITNIETPGEGERFSRTLTRTLCPEAHLCLDVTVEVTDDTFIGLSGTRLTSAEALLLSEWLRDAADEAAKGGAA